MPQSHQSLVSSHNYSSPLIVVYTCAGLSKWVRKRIEHEPGFEQAMSSLKSFANARMKADAESPDISSLRYTHHYLHVAVDE